MMVCGGRFDKLGERVSAPRQARGARDWLGKIENLSESVTIKKAPLSRCYRKGGDSFRGTQGSLYKNDALPLYLCWQELPVFFLGCKVTTILINSKIKEVF